LYGFGIRFAEAAVAQFREFRGNRVVGSVARGVSVIKRRDGWSCPACISQVMSVTCHGMLHRARTVIMAGTCRSRDISAHDLVVLTAQRRPRFRLRCSVRNVPSRSLIKPSCQLHISLPQRDLVST